MENYINKYYQYRDKIKALDFAFYLSEWDGSTIAPEQSFANRAKYIQILSEEYYNLTTNPEYIKAIEELYLNRSSLDDALAHEIEVQKKKNDNFIKVPIDEYTKYQEVLARASNTWAKDKQNNCFKDFKPILNDIFKYNRRYVKLLETPSLTGYDILLDEYENDYSTKEYDQFFKVIEERLVPFINKITALPKRYDDSFLTKHYPVELQKKVVEYFANVLCFDRSRGAIGESEHPFTTNFTSTDVRVTIHYYEEMFLSSIFSAIHELGHALYEQQIDPKFDGTFNGGGASMAIHESQSRLFENIIGRSFEFWEVHYPKIQEIYHEQLANVSLEQFVLAINDVQKSFVRTEADELTYPIHILLRYNLEKAIIEGKSTVDTIEEDWNKLFKKYFNLDVLNVSEGFMQDIHWAFGHIGYFPTYALGSAYASQIYHAMCNDLNIKEVYKSQTTKAINDWLKEHIHKYGSSKYPKEIIRLATGEDFNPNYYVDYLIEKYSKIYNI